MEAAAGRIPRNAATAIRVPTGRLSKMGRRLTSGETPDYGSILDRISQAVLERVRRKNS